MRTRANCVIIFFVSIVVASALVSGSIVTASPTSEKWPAKLIMATGPVAGSYHVQAIPWISKVSPLDGTVIEVQSVPIGPASVFRTDLGEIGFCFIGASQADMYLQYASFANKPQIKHVRALWSTQADSFPTIARAASGIKKVEDFRGKRLMSDNTHTGSMKMFALAAIEAHGLTADDVTWLRYGSHSDLIAAMVEGRADAVTTAAQDKPSSVWMELMQAMPLSYPDVDPNKLQALIDKGNPAFKAFMPTYLKPDLWKGMVHPLQSVGIATFILANADLPESLIYAMTKNTWDQIDAIKKDFPGLFDRWDLKTALVMKDWVAPYHAGAIKYFKEKGAWTAEHEKFQKSALQHIGMAK